MNRNTLSLLVIILAAGGLLFGLMFFISNRTREVPKSTPTAAAPAKQEETDHFSATNSSPIQSELEQLSSRLIRDLKEEQRLNLAMGATLRSYEEMFRQVHGYAKKVERELAMIEQIGKNEFQEDVKLQASLFGGKKPELVAKHLEEFRAGRVGAILAKMKEKEASAVLDVWAKQNDQKVSNFYREVMAAFLNNRRRDLNPALFNPITNTSEDEVGDEAVR